MVGWLGTFASERAKRQHAEAEERLKEIRSRQMVIGIDMAEPNGEYWVEYEATRQADGTFKITDWKRT